MVCELSLLSSPDPEEQSIVREDLLIFFVSSRTPSPLLQLALPAIPHEYKGRKKEESVSETIRKKINLLIASILFKRTRKSTELLLLRGASPRQCYRVDGLTGMCWGGYQKHSLRKQLRSHLWLFNEHTSSVVASWTTYEANPFQSFMLTVSCRSREGHCIEHLPTFGTSNRVNTKATR